LSQALIEVAAAMPAKQSLLAGNDALFNDTSAKDAPTKPQTPFVLQPWHWILIVLGSIAALFMLYWQLNEWIKSLRKRIAKQT
jgi:hypothetical protein